MVLLLLYASIFCERNAFLCPSQRFYPILNARKTNFFIAKKKGKGNVYTFNNYTITSIPNFNKTFFSCKLLHIVMCCKSFSEHFRQDPLKH